MHPPVAGPEKEKGQVSQKQHEPEGAEELGHHGPPQEILHETRIAGNAENKPHQGCRRQGQERVHAGGLGREKPGVHADHQELAVGEVHDVHDPKDNREPKGHEAQDHPDQETGDDGAEQNIHG